MWDCVHVHIGEQCPRKSAEGVRQPPSPPWGVGGAVVNCSVWELEIKFRFLQKATSVPNLKAISLILRGKKIKLGFEPLLGGWEFC